MEFKFELGVEVKIVVSEETGTVIGRADYLSGGNQVYVHYQDNNGCAKTEWFNESLIEEVEF